MSRSKPRQEWQHTLNIPASRWHGGSSAFQTLPEKKAQKTGPLAKHKSPTYSYGNKNWRGKFPEWGECCFRASKGPLPYLVASAGLEATPEAARLALSLDYCWEAETGGWRAHTQGSPPRCVLEQALTHLPPLYCMSVKKYHTLLLLFAFNPCICQIQEGFSSFFKYLLRWPEQCLFCYTPQVPKPGCCALFSFLVVSVFLLLD